MNLINPPEIADGGYWYVVPISEEPITGNKSPDLGIQVDFCAWYGVTHVAIRCTQVVVLPDVDLKTLSTVLVEAGYNDKPVGRLRGL